MLKLTFIPISSFTIVLPLKKLMYFKENSITFFNKAYKIDKPEHFLPVFHITR